MSPSFLSSEMADEDMSDLPSSSGRTNTEDDYIRCDGPPSSNPSPSHQALPSIEGKMGHSQDLQSPPPPAGFQAYTNVGYASSFAAPSSRFEYRSNAQSSRDDCSFASYAPSIGSTHSTLESEGTSEEPGSYFRDDQTPPASFDQPQFAPPQQPLSMGERRERRERQQLERRLMLQQMEGKISTILKLSQLWFKGGRDELIESMTAKLDQVIDAVVEEGQVKKEDEDEE